MGMCRCICEIPNESMTVVYSLSTPVVLAVLWLADNGPGLVYIPDWLPGISYRSTYPPIHVHPLLRLNAWNIISPFTADDMHIHSEKTDALTIVSIAHESGQQEIKVISGGPDQGPIPKEPKRPPSAARI
jgi:hypothetical protein